MTIGIGNDHTAVAMAEEIMVYLNSKGHKVIHYGTESTTRTDYPVYGKRVADAVVKGEVDCGILICGTGVGISIAANKVKGIRAVVCSEPYSAGFSKKHNNTNILAFGARVIDIDLAKKIIDVWLAAEFEGGRHQKRIDMVSEIEKI